MHKILLILLLALVGMLASAASCDESESDSSEREAEIEATVNRYFELINAEKMDEFYALFDTNVELHAPFGFEEATGVDSVRSFFDLILSNSETHHDVPVQIFVKGDEAAVIIEGTGGTPEEPVTLKAVDRMVFNDQGKIASLSVYFDTAPFLCP